MSGSDSEEAMAKPEISMDELQLVMSGSDSAKATAKPEFSLDELQLVMSGSDSAKATAKPDFPLDKAISGSYLLKPILSKMDITSFARMIRTNSKVKNFVDEKTSPLFFVPFPSYLSIDCNTSPSKIYIDRRQYKARVGEYFDHDLHNFTFEKIQIKGGSKPGFYNQALLEDLKRIGTKCRSLLIIRKMDQADLTAVVQAVNPQQVVFYLGLFDIKNPAFAGIQEIEMEINCYQDFHYKKEERIKLLFETEHKIIIWIRIELFEKITNGFLKYWRDGKANSRRKEITVVSHHFSDFPIEDKLKTIHDLEFDCSQEDLENELQKNEVTLFMTNVYGQKAKIVMKPDRSICSFNI